jgi:UDP-glucose:glycoprotein glucosyltransferase
MKSLCWTAIPIAVILCLLCPGHGKKGHGHRKLVTVSLQSDWKETALVLESSEFLAEENANSFWTFIDLLHEKLGDDTITKMHPPEQHSLAVDLAADVLASQSRVSLLKFALSLRMYSPTVEMFNQISLTRLRESENQCQTEKAFVEVSGSPAPRLLCDLNQLRSFLEQDMDAAHMHPETFRVDHPFSSHSDAHKVAILYGEIGSGSFFQYHEVLRQAAKAGLIKYYVRHYAVAHADADFVSLSGYGVELAIKSTEYRAVDDTRVKGEESSFTKSLKETEEEDIPEVAGFRISTLRQLHQEKKSKIDEFVSYLKESTKEVATLKVWQLQELSLQFAQKLISTPREDQLLVFQEMVQDFPVHAKSLIHVKVDKELRKEVEHNQYQFMQNLNLGTSDTGLFIDGLFFDLDTVDVFALYHHLKSEIKIVEGLHQILSGKNLDSKISSLLKLDVSSGKQDHFQIDFRDSAVVFINDIENDKSYKNWPSSIQDLLRPTYPGMLRNVRKNMYNLVLIIDPSKKETFDLIKLAESFYVHKAPLRVGFVFVTGEGSGLEDASVALLNVFNFLGQDKGYYEGISFITDVIAAVGDDDITTKNVIKLFKSKFPKQDVNAVFGPDSDYNTGRMLVTDFLRRTGLGRSTNVLLNGVVLNPSHLNGDMFEEAVLTEIMRQTPVIQKAVYNKELSDSNDITDWLMGQKSVLPRLNHRILKSENHTFVQLTGDIDHTGRALSDQHPQELLALFRKNVKYLTPRKSECAAITVWVAANLETESGRSLVRSALLHMRDSSRHMRVAILHSEVGPISRLVEASTRAITDSNQALNQVIDILDEKNVKLVHKMSDEDAVGVISADRREAVKAAIPAAGSHLQLCAVVFQKNFVESESGLVIVNGRVIPVPNGEIFTIDDFNLIEKQNFMTYAEKLQKTLSSDLKGSKCSDLVMKVASVLLGQPTAKTRHELKSYDEKKSVLSFPPIDPARPALDVVAVVEPLSRGAQKLIPLLVTLQQVVNMRMKIFLNCIDKHSDMPLKNFFRFVIEPELVFGENSLIKRSAVFASMPTKPLFTLAMMTPENWLVEAKVSPYDLDNIHLDQVDGKGVWAVFRLEHLLFEGHCFEQSTGNPPRGLQLVLASDSESKNIAGDTIVMANLGYFQLKAKPGAWKLALRPGRSSDIYQIMSYEGPDASGVVNANFTSLSVLISNFRSHVIKLKVNKKPGQTNRDLLTDDVEEDDANSIWSGGWSSWTGGTKSDSGDDGDDTVDIFSLASGHLYERLLRIMMLSVLKNTKSKVKFWFLKNYLSPTFKGNEPHQ